MPGYYRSLQHWVSGSNPDVGIWTGRVIRMVAIQPTCGFVGLTGDRDNCPSPGIGLNTATNKAKESMWKAQSSVVFNVVGSSRWDNAIIESYHPSDQTQTT